MTNTPTPLLAIGDHVRRPRTAWGASRALAALLLGPSHAVKRQGWRRALLDVEIRAVLRPGMPEAELQATADTLLNLAA